MAPVLAELTLAAFTIHAIYLYIKKNQPTCLVYTYEISWEVKKMHKLYPPSQKYKYRLTVIFSRSLLLGDISKVFLKMDRSMGRKIRGWVAPKKYV